MKKIKLLVGGAGHNIGDIVDYKLFKELADKEIESSISNPRTFEENDVFIKDLSGEDQYFYMYMLPEEFEFVEGE